MLTELVVLLDTGGPLLIDAAVKGLIVVAAAAVMTLLIRRNSAASRHLVWTIAAVGLISLPVLPVTLPVWREPVLELLHSLFQPRGNASVVHSPVVFVPSEAHVHESERSAPAPPLQDESAVSYALKPSRPGHDTPAIGPSTATATLNAHVPVEAGEMAVVSPAENSSEETGSTSFVIHIPLLWLVGVLVSLLMPVVGLSQLFLLARRSRSVDSDDWNRLLQQLRGDLRIRRRVRLLQSSRTKAPLTWGALRPVVLLPAEAVDWPESRRQMVLLHELSHVKRLDWLTQMIGQLASALHWFNPQVWIVARRMQVEREQACDDMVLSTGATSTDYADELLHFSTRLRSASLYTLAAVPMARKSSLELRVRCILDDTLRRRSLSRFAVCAAVAVGCCVVIPLAMLQAFVEIDVESIGDGAPVSTPDSKGLKAVFSSSKGLAAWSVVDGKDVVCSFLHVGGFKAQVTESEKDGDAWRMSGTLKFSDTEVLVEASSENHYVKINGMRANFDYGRVFIIDTRNPRPQLLHQVHQLKVKIPRITTRNLEDVFALAHQPGFLPINKSGFAGEFPPGSGQGVNVEAYTRHDEFRTRFAVMYSASEWKTEEKGTNNPKDGSWKIDTTFTLDDQTKLRMRCDSSEPDTLLIGSRKFDLTKGRVIEAGRDGSLIQHPEFPRVLRTPADLVALYSRIKKIEPKAVELTARRVWDMPGGVTLEITRESFHAAYVPTKAILRWPALGDRPALRHEIHIAADFLGDRDIWSAIRERGTTRLWLANTGASGMRVPNLRAVDFADPTAVITWTEYGNHEADIGEPNDDVTNARRRGFSIAGPLPKVPGEVMAKLIAKFPSIRELGKGLHTFGGQHAEAASTEAEWTIQGSVRDASGQPMKGILVHAMTEYRPTISLARHRTGADGRYVLSFRTDLTTLAKHRGVIIKPILAGSADEDFGRSGELSMLLREDETADLSFSERTAILGKSTVASFVLKPAATVEGDVVGADGKALPSPSVGIRYPGQRKNYLLTSAEADERGHFRLTGVPSGKPLMFTVRMSPNDHAEAEGFVARRGSGKRVRLRMTGPSSERKLSFEEHDQVFANPRDRAVRVRIVKLQKEVDPPKSPSTFADNVLKWVESCRENKSAAILKHNPDVWSDVMKGHSLVHVVFDPPRMARLVDADGNRERSLLVSEVAFAMNTSGTGGMFVKAGDQILLLDHWTLQTFLPVIRESALNADQVMGDWYKRFLDATSPENPPPGDDAAVVFLTTDKKLLFDGKAVDHNSLIARLREAGFTKESTVVLKFSPDARVKELHWPLWRLRTSRWNHVRIELPDPAPDE